MRRVWLSLVVLAVLVMVATACGKKTSENSTEQTSGAAMRVKSQDAEVTINSDTMRIKSKDGDVSLGEGTKLPDQWPTDVPVYKGLKLLSAMKSKESFSIQGTTPDSLDKVSAFYKEQVTKSGWEEQTVTTQPQMAMMSYTKEKRSLSVVIGGQESETSVSVSISRE